MRATLLVRSRDQRIATVTTKAILTTDPQTDGKHSRKETITTNIRQYYTTDPQTDGILVLVQDEGDTGL